MAIYYVHPQFLPDIWPAIEADVARACEYHPHMDAPDVRKLFECGRATLFIATGPQGLVGFAGVEVVEYPSRTVCNVLGIGGKRGFLAVAIDELMPVVLSFGKTQGATVVALSGRPGWLRVLSRFGGSSQRYITMWADIDEQWRRRYQTDDNTLGTDPAVPP
jgi:hypothetical protein